MLTATIQVPETLPKKVLAKKISEFEEALKREARAHFSKEDENNPDEKAFNEAVCSAPIREKLQTLDRLLADKGL
ncbi:hypothetical protein WDW89_12035 [Deltaproteobacteria bacterium TL4]